MQSPFSHYIVHGMLLLFAVRLNNVAFTVHVWFQVCSIVMSVLNEQLSVFVLKAVAPYVYDHYYYDWLQYALQCSNISI